MKVSKDLLEVSAQGDGGRCGLGELCRSLKVSPSRPGLGGLECPLGSWGAPGSADVGNRLDSGAPTHLLILG